MKDKTRHILQYYVEKASKLKRLQYAEHVMEVGLKLNLQRTDDSRWLPDFGLPDEKDRDAFLLTLRMFIQKNEPISFERIERVLEDPELSNEFREGAKSVCKNYFNYLDGHSSYSVKLFDGHPTRRKMLNTILYGGLAHGNNEETVARFKNWSRDEIRANVLMQEFVFITIFILELIMKIAELSEAELVTQLD